jgi:hypothetical protein
MAKEGQANGSGINMTLAQVLAGAFALVVAAAGGTFAVMKLAIEHPTEVSPTKPGVVHTVGRTEEEQFLRDQLRFISSILHERELKHTVEDTFVEVAFASRSGEESIVIQIVPRFSSRDVGILACSQMYVDQAKRGAALSWINDQNRELIYGRYYIAADDELILDWAFRTSDEGPPPTPFTVVLYAMTDILDEDMETIRTFAGQRTSKEPASQQEHGTGG